MTGPDVRKVDTAAVEEATKALAEAYTRLAKARADYACIRGLNGQTGYAVSVNGVRVGVAEMDPRTYSSKMIRGREMIHLGALKAMAAVIEDCEATVAAKEADLAALARMEPAS